MSDFRDTRSGSRRKFLKGLAAAGGATILGAPYISNAQAAKGHTWKVQSV